MNRLPHWKKILRFHAAGFFFFLVILFTFGKGYAQQISPAKPGQKVHAIVIGISKYKDTRIPALKFADRDARLFADFLKSSSGGNVPAGQISLLLNEKATFSEIDNAIADLYENVGKGHRVYFYFSGHGDVENQTFAKLGFLLAYNTPANNYIRNAIRLEDINLMARTLSTQKNVEVILITDACRSGNLAGGLKGSRVVGESLRMVERNEVRFASCLPNQLSQESALWGGGRGVFSYYLLNGLYGAAAKPGSKAVVVSDLKSYLVNSLSTDKILRNNKIVQQPLVTGNLQVRMSEAIASSVAPFATGATALAPTPLDIFKNELRNRKMEDLFDTSNISNATPEQIRNMVFERILITLTDSTIKQSVVQLQKLCGSSKNAASRTNAEISSLISEKGQEVISDYLLGDMAELERRNYYNIKKGEYDRYVSMYAAALKLLPKNHTLYERIQVASLYFEGLLCRLKMPLVEDSKDLLDKGMVLQLAALKLEPFAAYIHNELANLYATKGRIDSARYHYDYASKIAPTWAVPVANLAGLYNYEGNIKKAREIAERARELQPDLVSLMVNEGVTAELEKNWLRAEEMQLRSIFANSRHYLSYERLGYVFSSTARFQQADSLFFEAFQRKKGYFFPKPDSSIIPVGYPPTRMNMPKLQVPCFIVPLPEEVTDPLLLTIEGKQYTYLNESNQAEASFTSALKMEPDNFLACHYFARYLFEHNRMIEAAYYFKLSSAFYRSGKIIELLGGKYPLKPLFTQEVTDECFRNEIDNLYFDSSLNSLFLLSIYQQLGYIAEAEKICYSHIQSNELTRVIKGVQWLSNLYKESNQWRKAEQTLLEYRIFLKGLKNKGDEIDPSFHNIVSMEARCELDTFYQEVALRFPDEEYWALQSARHWFNSIMESPVDYYFEDQNLEQSIQGIPDTLFFMWNAAKSNPFYTMDRFKNPVRGLTIEYPYLVEYPYRVCIKNINHAILLAESDENIGDLYKMLGTIYYATRQYNKAAENFAAAIEFLPADANLRRTTALAFQQSFRLTNALNHLDTLRKKDRLLADDYLTFAAMAIHGKQFEQAAEVLESASQLFTGIQKDSVMQLKARMYFVQQDARCVAYYTDSIQTTMTLADRLYAVASMYAIKADDARAYQYLNQSLEHGFLYGYVLENDPVWARFRLQKQWDQIIKNRSFKTYAITDFSSSQ